MIRFSIPVCILSVLLMGCPVHAGDVVDRIVAMVNGHAILQSDWEDALHYEAFIAGHSSEQLTSAERKSTLACAPRFRLIPKALKGTTTRNCCLNCGNPERSKFL